jgi:site-specific DNA-methyltransferase (adenine-specific)
MSGWPQKNLLCYGDNLPILKHFDNECIDLVYLDPPFNSQQNYNVLFKETSGAPETAQIKAFEDTWKWDQASNLALNEINTDPAVPPPLVGLMRTFFDFLKPSPMMAYLVQMAIRLVHLHRVLKPTGSLYLHCDPTASHYLKLVLDATFGPTNFQNEIIWKRTSARSDSHRWNHIHDIILFYTKSSNFAWNPQHIPYEEAYTDKFYNRVDPESGRRYASDNLTASGTRNGSSGDNWHGIDVRAKGIHWKYTIETLEELDAEGRIIWPKKKGGVPRYKRYLDEMPGLAIQSIVNDIPPLSAQSAEKLGYPTQKPVGLLRRIVAASSNPGDVVLDPFCGCGTTIDAVETLNREQPEQPPRKWIGIDITHLSTNLIKHRLTRFTPPPEYDVMGEPVSTAGAVALFAQDPYDFQLWALGLVGARPTGGAMKKGADRGIDGVRFFQDEQKGGAWIAKKMLVQVKGGHTKSGDIRDFVGTLSREQAEMGVFLTLEDPSQPMRTEAASAGTYAAPLDPHPYPKIQILTISELIGDPQRPNPRCLQIPGGASAPNPTLPEPPKHRRKGAKQKALDF